MSKRSIWLIVLTICLIGVFIGWKMWNKPFSDPLHGEAIKVTASQLFNDFNTNESNAQKIYVPEKVDNKVVEVSGIIKDSGRNTDGEQFYVLKSADEMFGVKCVMEKGYLLPNAKPGDNLCVRGFCTGYNLDVIVNRCRQVK